MLLSKTKKVMIETNELMSDGQRIKEILIAELKSIPPYLWGGFFPAHIAIWRFLSEKAPDYFGKIQAIKDSSISSIPSRMIIDDMTYLLNKYPVATPDDFEPQGYGIVSERADMINNILWGKEEIVSIVERLSYFLTDCLTDILDANDQLKYLPLLDDNILSELAALCISEYNSIINKSTRRDP
jgi:hypothetical protein